MDAEDSKSSAFPEAALLVGAAQSVWQGSDSRVTIEIHAESKLRRFMSERGIKSLERVYITDSDIRHIMKHHAADEIRRGQINIVPTDFGFVPSVLNDFDSCICQGIDRLGNMKFQMTKIIDDAYYVVTVQRGRKKLQVKTMWKKPGASCQPQSDSLGPTSETTPASGSV